MILWKLHHIKLWIKIWWFFICLIKSNILQSPLSIRILTLRDDYLPLSDRNIFIEFFQTNLNCLLLSLQSNNSLPETIQLFLEQFQSLYSLDIIFNEPISMLIHVKLCQLIQQRPHASAELRPTDIRIWQKWFFFFVLFFLQHKIQ